MSSTVSQYIDLGLAAFAVSGLPTWPVRKLAILIGAMDHLSHRLVRIGFTHRHAALILWGTSGISAGTAYLVYKYFSSLDTELILCTAITWTIFSFYFLWIPSEDMSKSNLTTKRAGAANE